MIIGLISIIVVLLFSIALIHYGNKGYEGRHLAIHFCGSFIGVLTALTAILYSCLLYCWISSEYKATIINREYKTNYTREEVFYASGVIETIRELERNRYEINGNIANQCNQ